MLTRQNSSSKKTKNKDILRALVDPNYKANSPPSPRTSPTPRRYKSLRKSDLFQSVGPSTNLANNNDNSKNEQTEPINHENNNNNNNNNNTDNDRNDSSNDNQNVNHVFDDNSFGFSINTFGFGSDHDPILLKAIADKAGGIYYYIQDESKLAMQFADCFGGLVSTVAQNIELRIDTVNGTRMVEVLNKKISPGQTLKLGDIQSEERKDIVFEVELAAVPNPFNRFHFATANLSYYDVICSRNRSIEIDLHISRLAQDSNEVPNVDLDKNLNRLKVAKTLQLASDLANAGRLSEARDLISSQIRSVEESVSKDDPFCISLVEEMKLSLQDLSSEYTFRSRGSHKIANTISSHMTQRSSNPFSPSHFNYNTKSRTFTSANWADSLKKT